MDTPHLFSLPQTAKWHARLCRMGSESWQMFEEGNVFGEYDKSTAEYTLVMEDRQSPSTVLFRSVIRAPMAFQKQEGLLLWTGSQEAISSAEMARSSTGFWQDEQGLARIAFAFQSVQGCALISEFVLYAIFELPEKDSVAFAVQEHGTPYSSSDPDGEDGLESPSDAYAVIIDEPFRYPPRPTRDNLIIVKNAMEEMLKSNFGHELLVIFLLTKNYFDQIWDVFGEIVPKSANDNGIAPLERIQLLWSISDIVKQYVTSGDVLIIERLVDYEQFVKCLSMLEYDRGFGTRKANFRDYYCQQTAMRRVARMNHLPVHEKIQRTFRLQMLRDVLLRTCDDFTFVILRQLISLGHAEILENLNSSPEYCDELFSLFSHDDEERDTRNDARNDARPADSQNADGGRAAASATEDQDDVWRDEAVEFVNEVMKTAKVLPPAQLKSLYVKLIESGLIDATIYGLMKQRRPEIKLLTLEMLSLIFDFDTTMVFLPTRGPVILRAIVDMVYEDDCPYTGSKTSMRAVQLESFDLLKKVLSESSEETYNRVFELIDRTSWAASAEKLIPTLDIYGLCYTFYPELSSAVMARHEIWRRVSACMSDSQVNPIIASKLFLATMRLLRKVLLPDTSESDPFVSSQANAIIDSGLAARLVDHVCMRTPRLNDAENSSFLSLLQLIVDGRKRSADSQLATIADWMAMTDSIDRKKLCAQFPIVNKIVLEGAKRTSSEQLGSEQLGSEQLGSVSESGPSPQRQKLGEPFK